MRAFFFHPYTAVVGVLVLGISLTSSTASAQATQALRRTGGAKSAGSVLQAAQPGKNISSDSLDTVLEDRDPDLAAQYEECDFNCKYRRSNEVVSIQVDYLQTTLAVLSPPPSQTGAPSSPPLGAKDKKALLGAFCADAEDGDDCGKRFQLYAVKALARAQRAIAINNESAQNLVSVDGLGGVQLTVPAGTQPAARKVTAPYVPKLSAIQTAATVEQGELLRYLGSDSYLEEVRTTLVPKPDPRDFIEMVPRKENPKDPKSKTSWVPKRDARGEFVLDKVAFARANFAYEVAQKTFLKNTGIAAVGAQACANGDKSEICERSRGVQRELLAFVSGKSTPVANRHKNGVNRDMNLMRAVYKDTREGVVKDVNQKIANKKSPGARALATKPTASTAVETDVVEPEKGAAQFVPYDANSVQTMRNSTQDVVNKIPEIEREIGMAPAGTN